jgi:hypothetical protein
LAARLTGRLSLLQNVWPLFAAAEAALRLPAMANRSSMLGGYIHLPTDD